MSYRFTLPSAVLCVVLGFVVGCPSTAKPPVAAAEAHPETGPHKGDLIELGKEEYHAELVHDDATHTISIYVLDGAAKAAVMSEAKEVTLKLVVGGEPKQFTLPAKPQAGDEEGKTSLFEITDEPLCEAMDQKGVKPRLNITIGGKEFVGEISAHDHDHGHKH